MRVSGSRIAGTRGAGITEKNETATSRVAAVLGDSHLMRAGTPDVNNGKQLFQSKGCIACHVAQGVPGATGTIGPNLNGIGDPAKRPALAVQRERTVRVEPRREGAERQRP